MRGVTESLAGRVAVFELLPLSTGETDRVSLLRGGFPEAIARPAQAATWFRSYLQTYLERDVRTVTAVRDLPTFRRFLALLASRAGQLVNRTDLASSLGVSIPTIGEWLGVLEVTQQILLVPPFFENFGKRLVKSPKLYFLDSGLACHLLGIETAATLRDSPFLGPLFEGFVASEVVKAQTGAGRRKEVYHFRDERGLEVDFVIPAGHRRLLLVEAKASRTARPEMAEPLDRLARSMSRYGVERLVVHRPTREAETLEALRPGASAVGIEGLLKRLRAHP